MKKEKDKTNKPRKFRYYVTALIAIAIALFFIYVYHQGFDFIFANVERDILAEKLSGKDWARRIELPGLPNFYKVSNKLYRGAQPTKQGIEQLNNLGIKTIVNLRSFHSDKEELADSNLLYEHIVMKPWHPEDKKMIGFLKILTNESNQPVFVHCRRGADRTGVMCAVYRIVVQGWSKQQAIEEMTKGGFSFNKIYTNLITYIEQLDVEKIKKAVKLQKIAN